MLRQAESVAKGAANGNCPFSCAMRMQPYDRVHAPAAVGMRRPIKAREGLRSGLSLSFRFLVVGPPRRITLRPVKLSV